MKRFLLLGRSLRHTPVSQIVARLRLVTRRWLSDLASTMHVPGGPARAPPLLASQPPQPVFQARMHNVSDGQDDLVVDLAGTKMPIDVPVAWTSDALQRGSLEMLTLHYTEFLESLPNIEGIVLDWIRANPATDSGAWRDSWNSYTISLRAVVWMQQIAARPSAFSASGLATTTDSLATQIRFLERHLELDIRGNHLIKNLKCLLWAGRFFRGPEADSWFARGTELLEESLREQILDDGMHYERSASYHNQVLADLTECYALIEEPNLRTLLGVTLDAMAQVSVDLTHPDGYPSMMNDGGFTMAYSSKEITEVLARLGRTHPHPGRVVNLPDAGYFGIRLDDEFVLIDCGPIGPDALPAHSHGDILSFEWSVGGERVILDAGTYEYRAGANRTYSRSTAAHNTVTLSGQDQAEFWRSFRVGNRPDVSLETVHIDGNRMRLAGSHDGFSQLPGSPIHHRTFDVGASEIAITDRIDGGDGQAAIAGLLISPTFRVQTTSDGFIIEGKTSRLRVTGDAAFTTEQASYSEDLGDLQTATRIIAHYGNAPTIGHINISIIDPHDG